MTEGREGFFWDAVAGKVPPPPCAVLLDSTFVDVEPGRARMRFRAKEEFYNPAGVVQGGILAAMLDDTLGPAAASTVGPQEFVTTVEMKISFLRPAKAGELIGEGRVVHKGRSIIFVEGTLSAGGESPVATATGTWRVVPFNRDE
ncbi:MAG: PaaI family thioesterase [Chloroflexi bacterium]|nr:PaaI family thioesterase [Chloroflexota bacterium]